MRLTWIEGLCLVAIVVATAELRSGERGARLAALTATPMAASAVSARMAAPPRPLPGAGSAREGSAAPSRSSHGLRQ